LEFDFDDVIVNSKVYRRVLASARGKVLEANRPIIEGDLIDLSDSQTVTEGKIDEVTQDLECLIVSQHEQPVKALPEPSISQTANDLSQPRMFAGQEIPERENTRALYTTNVSQKHRDDSVNVPGYVSSKFVEGGDPDINKTLQENSENPKKEVRFGDYVLGRTLHVGKQSKVKLCWKVEGGVQVAIKLIKCAPLVLNPTLLANIYREIAILRELHHPNIVRLVELLETERHIGVILEYASGGDLLDYISNHRYLRDNAAQRIFAQLVCGVGYLHKKGVVHRDLKPENIFLDRNRNIIISGFTWANTFNPEDELGDEIEYDLPHREFVKRWELDKILPNGSRRGDLMQTRCGAPIYAAPELVSCTSVYKGRKVDIWSCGVILVSLSS
jgi:serine/threonine protein kinase